MIGSLLLGATLLNVYAVALILARGWAFGTRIYRPMLWNVWLSVAPILVMGAGVIVSGILLLVSPWLGIASTFVFGIVWLLLLPNASYLITELNFSHRGEDDPVPLWYDIILVISLAMSGVCNTVLNVFLAHLMYATTRYEDSAQAMLRPDALWFVAFLLLLLGFGMYLGRYLRLNSWDIRSPKRLFTKVWGHFREGKNLRAGLGFTVTYALFLGIMYLMIGGTAVLGLSLIEQARGLG
ncbi:DUF1361 domain-containing protein [Leucobacter sp. M11]|uniref:DUF1361 domain-containing protein n=1 Tax=Leucobacter sp. M11 TaxID=2993565 RepID=UPI002D7EDD3D|nr:DUF1361 domain-containing protein [Leucobacter sp. M11]MEB4615822.1 DUF1361 domain-containing protein [Leucobacter sp. M11]